VGAYISLDDLARPVGVVGKVRRCRQWTWSLYSHSHLSSHCAFHSDLRRRNRVGGGTQLSGKTFLRPGSSGTGPGQGAAKRGSMWTRTPRSVFQLTAFACHPLNSKPCRVLHASNQTASSSLTCCEPLSWLLTTRCVGRGVAEDLDAICLTRRPTL
jgi:hypothetical protein